MSKFCPQTTTAAFVRVSTLLLPMYNHNYYLGGLSNLITVQVLLFLVLTSRIVLFKTCLNPDSDWMFSVWLINESPWSSLVVDMNFKIQRERQDMKMKWISSAVPWANKLNRSMTRYATKCFTGGNTTMYEWLFSGGWSRWCCFLASLAAYEALVEIVLCLWKMTCWLWISSRRVSESVVCPTFCCRRLILVLLGFCYMAKWANLLHPVSLWEWIEIMCSINLAISKSLIWMYLSTFELWLRLTCISVVHTTL